MAGSAGRASICCRARASTTATAPPLYTSRLPGLSPWNGTVMGGFGVGGGFNFVPGKVLPGVAVPPVQIAPAVPAVPAPGK